MQNMVKYIIGDVDLNQEVNNSQTNPTTQQFQPGTGSYPQQPVAQPMPQQPVAPVQPTYSAPVQPQPVQQQPVYQQPVQPQPVYQQPMYNAPNQNTKKKKIVPIFIIIALLIVAVAAFAIFGNGKKDYTRTVMIYMVGSNLESGSGLATVDLESIRYNPNLKVVLIAGGSQIWHNNYIDTSETSIFELRENGFVKVKEQTRKNMGASDTLTEFLNYAYDNYKSDKYDLIFWNHGGAIDGSEYDDLSNGDNLSLSEIKKSLSSSPFGGKNKLEIVIFRTCLNSTIEVANTFDDYADYLVASEEVTLGAPYTNVLSFMNDVNTGDTAVDIGRKYVDSYKRQISDIKNKTPFGGGDAIYSTYAIIKLSKVDNLITSVNDFFGSIDSTSNFNTISRVRANLHQYGSDVAAYDMVDLYNLVYELKDLSPSKADRLLADLGETVIYNWATNPESRGLSIYFPYNGKESHKQYFISIYNDFLDLSTYKTFIRNFYYNQNSSYTRYAYSSNATAVNFVEEEGETVSDFTLELTDEQVETFAKARYYVFRDNKNGYYKPVYVNGQAKLEGNTLKASVRDRQLRVVSKDNPDEGFTLISIEKENDERYIKYEAYVILDSFRGELVDWKMDRATMTITYDKTTKEIALSNIVYDTDDGLVNSAVVDLDEYDNIEFSISSGYKILDDNGEYVGPTNADGTLRSDGTITGWEEKPDNFEFVLESFDDEYDYYGVFVITDTHNNVSYSKLVKMN